MTERPHHRVGTSVEDVDGLLVAHTRYACRICKSEEQMYARLVDAPDDVRAAFTVDAPRTTHMDCVTCGQRRTHVFRSVGYEANDDTNADTTTTTPV